MTYKRGDVVKINLGDVSEVKGHEQAMVRPCLIIKYLEHHNLAVIIPFSTNQNYNLSYCSVEIEIRQGNGLSSISYALCHQIRTVSAERIMQKKGELNQLEIEKITSVLLDFLDTE